jgi:NADPH:quinone reductase-like Zn-dependent oxidoreductase
MKTWDNSVLSAKVFANRAMFGLFRPSKMNILGADSAGTVETVGKDVRDFKAGDEVLGDLSGQH